MSRWTAEFDSATAMVRALAAALQGRSFPLLGSPAPLEPAARAAAAGIDHVPPVLREAAYTWSGAAEAVPPSLLCLLRSDRVARRLAGRYPRRRFPAAMIGASSGAAVHLAAALGVPWLPQTVLVPVRQRGHPEDPGRDLEAGRAPGRRLLRANPDLQLHHMHDANQDRLMIRAMAYFRVKWRRLPGAYRSYLEQTLAPGATLFVLDCGLRWPVTRMDERHLFQHGAVGGMAPAEYQERWGGPAPDAEAPEAEWGFEPALLDDLEALAGRNRWRLARVAYDQPEDLSPVVADLYRDWYAELGRPTDRLLVETFILLDPHQAITTSSVPLWVLFGTAPSCRAVAGYLDRSPAYDEIRMTLFSHGVDSTGLASAQEWRTEVLDRARKLGSFLGVNEGAYPRDFGTVARYHHALAHVRHRFPVPPPLPLDRALERLAPFC